MYLISIYFDEKTNNRIQRYMNRVAEESGNTSMIEAKVPPHITISAFETRMEHEAVRLLEKNVARLKSGTLTWVSVGVFLPYVLYLAPVLNEYLHGLSSDIYKMLSEKEEISVSKYYRPFQWLPHTTIGRKLSAEEMQTAFRVMQEQFGVFSGQVIEIGLARTNPHEDIVRIKLI